MNIHKNARTTPRSRGQIVARVLTHEEAPAAVAAAVGVSERTVRKWVARYTAEAEAGRTVLPGGVSISRSLVEHWYGGPLPGSW